MRPPFLLAALSALLLNACYSAGDGKAPPLEELYFPTGLALDRASLSEDGSGAPRYLYVASSDFDLQYRSASLVSYDLDALRKLVPQSCNSNADCQGGALCDAPGADGIPSDASRVPSYFCVDPATLDPCGSFGARDTADRLLYPGRCKSIDPKDPQDGSPSLLVDKVGIGAFATNVIWRANPEPNPDFLSRLFLPVRGDATLHWIDLNNGRFECGQRDTDDNSCSDQHRSGESTSDNLDELRQPAEPFAVDATTDGAYVAITNQTQGSVSLYANDWRRNGGPKLVSILSGLPSAPVGIAAIPAPAFASGETTAPGFLVAYRNSAQIDLLRVRSDDADTGTALADYTRYALREAGSVPITANSLGFDSRGIVIDDAQRIADYEKCGCEKGGKACDAATPACLVAVHQPAVYVANRAPSSLLVGALTADFAYPSGTNDLPSFADSVALTAGPSRVILGYVKVRGTAASATDAFGPYELERRVFVVCFDSRRIFVYDPKRRVIDSIVNTGRGPYALAVDELRGLAYVAHFTDSYLSVIGLDQRFPQSYATIVASIGAPTPPRTSK